MSFIVGNRGVVYYATGRTLGGVVKLRAIVIIPCVVILFRLHPTPVTPRATLVGVPAFAGTLAAGAYGAGHCDVIPRASDTYSGIA